MKGRILLFGAVLAVATACGASQDDQIVMKDPSNGKERTFKEVRDMFADGSVTTGGESCATFVSFGAKDQGIEFPAGQAEFVKACEEGLKAKSN
ncbi:hypothetical protein E1264_03330 [Actinomadura sp. KC216]|uniref:hypothetical protein n=1 Tax=Actinomadura sp. KC216 TaxID=2530370 RepID=UPI00104319D9|nr:hypothetical protein [Actinomadura sp. KC216]TDB90871.1 hypothetical protein E1264_03330 [Actinomadura sp. KC216]